VKGLLPLFALLAVVAPAHAVPSTPGCLDPACWQRLANRIHAVVSCPGYLPEELDGKIGGRWNTIDATSVWLGRGALHSLSEHVAPPLDFSKVVTLLKQQLRSRVVSRPR
jgi:hypothetical protein